MSPSNETARNAAFSTDPLSRIETALQRVPHNLNWIADEGEPAMDALRLLRDQLGALEASRDRAVAALEAIEDVVHRARHGSVVAS